MPPDTSQSKHATPPASGEIPRMLAPHHLRLFALIVDYLLVVIALKLGHQAFLGQGWDLETRFGAQGLPGIPWLIALALLGLFKDSAAGRSPGKWLTGLAVVDAIDPTRRAPPGRCILRNLLLFLLPLEAVWVLADRYGRRLGDRLAGTVVVVPPRVSPPGRRLLVFAIGFLASLLVAFLITAWNLRRSAAYQTAIQAAATHPQVLQTTGEPVDFGFSPELELSFPTPDRGMGQGPRTDPAGDAPPGADIPAGGRATLLLEVSGPMGETKVRVTLDLLEAPRRWDVHAVELVTEEPRETQLQQSPAPKNR